MSDFTILLETSLTIIIRTESRRVVEREREEETWVLLLDFRGGGGGVFVENEGLGLVTVESTSWFSDFFPLGRLWYTFYVAQNMIAQILFSRSQTNANLLVKLLIYTQYS